MHVSVCHPLPPDLIFDIEHYKGSQSRESSLSSTPDGLDTPRRLGTPDGLKTPIETPKPIVVTAAIVDEPPQQQQQNGGFVISAKDIPKSPHLSKDFSPNGERIRDSIRARRQQRMMKNRENQRKSLEVDVWGDSRPYGDKGFIINVREGGLTLNNVKDLENCSDVDSSCDTSLNYVEVNEEIPKINEKVSLSDLKPRKTSELQIIIGASDLSESSYPLIRSPKPIKSEKLVAPPMSDKTYKSTLDDIRAKLNLYKTRLDSIESASKDTISSSKNSMRNYFKSKPINDEVSPSMFSRTKPEVTTDKSTSKFTSRVFRVNETPIFERRNARSLFTTSFFKRSDSDENLNKTNQPKQQQQQPIEKTFSFKQKISPTSDLKPNYSFESTPKKNSTSVKKDDPQIFSYKSGNTNLRPQINKTTEKSPIFNQNFFNLKKSNFSPQKLQPKITTTKTNEKYVNLSNLNDRPVTNVKKPNYFDSSNAKNSSKMQILSPESIRQLNAKFKTNSTGGGFVRSYNNPVESVYRNTRASTNNNNLLAQRLVDTHSIKRNINRFDKVSGKGCVLESTAL